MPTLPPGESSTSGNLALTKFVDNFNNWGGAMNANLDTVDAAVTAVQTAAAANIPESKVTNLTTDLAAKAPLASPTFTGQISGAYEVLSMTHPYVNLLNIQASNSVGLAISNGATGNEAVGYINQNFPSSSSGLSFGTQATERMKIDGSGNVSITTGNLTVAGAATETVTIQGGSSQGSASLLLLKDSTSTHTLKVSDSSGLWTVDSANSNGGQVIFKQGIGVYNGGQILNANVSGGLQFNSDASITLLGGNLQQASAVLNAGTIKAQTSVAVANQVGDSLIQANGTTGDKGIVIRRDNTGAEYLRILGCAAGGSGQNNTYLFDRIANPNQRPLYFRRSSDGGTTFTNDLIMDAAGNVSIPTGTLSTAAVTASGQVTSTVATGTAPLVVASTTPVANLTLTSAAPSGYGLGGVANRLTAGIDLNTVTANGWYDVNIAVNAPAFLATTWLKLFVQCSADINYVTQQAFDMALGTNRRFIRNRTSGTWNAWQEMSSASGLVEGTTGSGAVVQAYSPSFGGNVNLAGAALYNGSLMNNTLSGSTITSPTITGGTHSNPTLTGTTTAGAINAGVLQTNGGGVAGAGTQPVATPVYVQSRGQNMVSNGSGLLGNNYNFSPFTFDATDTFSGAGSFKTATVQQGVQNDEFIPVDPTQMYTVSGWGKCGDASGANFYASNIQYLGVCPFDIDSQMITPEFYSKFPGATDTTLAATLNVGDTTMTVVNATGWKNSGASNMAWWPYTNSKGYSYPAYTYTRYDSNNLIAAYQTSGMWNTGGVVGNVITLSAPWPGPQLPAGTPVRNGNAGGTYKYIAAQAAAVPNAWTNYSGQIGTLDTGGTQNQNTFPYGTAYMRLLFLVNYQGATGGTNNVRWNNLSVGLTPGTGSHLVGNSGTPAIAAGTGAGTTPTISLQAGSTDASGYINITTGTSPAGGNAVVSTITFKVPYLSAPKVILVPANAAAAALSGANEPFTPIPSTTAFTVNAGSTALAASMAYVWAYQVIG